MPEIRDESVIVDTTLSLYARLRPVPISAVKLNDCFWEPRRQINRSVLLPEQYQFCEETGRIDNFLLASGKKQGSFQGYYFNDSDIYKWIEAASWTLATDFEPELAKKIALLAVEIAAMQQPDGYLNSYFAQERFKERWTNLRFMHELYVAGHFIQAAIAHKRVTGSDQLLHIACRLADHICQVFGPLEEGKKAEADGHPEVEMALVELFRVTGERRYLTQAQFFLDIRRGLGRMNHVEQELLPFRDLQRLAGHAVCAVYLMSGVTDIYAETGEPELSKSLMDLWQNMTSKQLYITGGIG